MGDSLTQFKKTSINNAKKTYTNNINALTRYYTQLINQVKKVRMSVSVKNSQIRNYNNEFNSKKNLLTNTLNTYIASINALKYNDIPNRTNKNALVIGINYTNTNYQLNGCINDANFMNDNLSSLGFSNIKLLTDNTPEKPTRESILTNFSNLLSSGNPGDILLFYYSGHGSYTKDTNNEEVTGNDQLLVPSDFNMITDDELKSIMQQKLKKDVLLLAVFDSCFSQSVLDTRFQYLDSLNNNETFINVNQSETDGNVIVISGCSDKQTSEDAFINNVNRGALTWSFLETLKNNANISWRQLITNMRNLLKNSNYSQIPQLSSGKFINIDTQVFI